MAERNMDVFLARLQDPNLDLKNKLQIATDLRDNIELWSGTSTYTPFLQKFVPVFLGLLDGPPVFLSTSPEQRLRNCVLEILHRLPMNPGGPIEAYAPQIVEKLMAIVKVENEDNAILCMKTIMDFERHLPTVLGDKVQPFLNIIMEMFESMEQVVKDTFDSPGASQGAATTPQYSQSPRPGSPVASTSDIGGEQQQARQLQLGLKSFKVLSECPIIVVSLFQAHRSCVPRNVKNFVPLIKTVLMLQANPQQRAHAEAKAQGKTFTGVSKDIRNRAAFGDFITAQVKTMSFLAYLLRVYAQQLNDFLPTLPEIVVRLLKDCPREKSAARKELLVAIRHIINFNFRKIFLKKIDELLDERTLIGDGLTVYETMRPLAYSMLADLIHHVRESLNKEQIRRTVEVYTKNLHDTFPGTSFQTMSAKLLLNMTECIAKLEDKKEARFYLIMILKAIGDKFAAMNRGYANAVKLTSQMPDQKGIEPIEENYLADKNAPPDWDEIDIFHATPIKVTNPRDRGADPVADNKFLFKNLLHGLKNLFYQLRQCNPQKLKDEIDPANAPSNWGDVSYGFNAEEVEVLITLFREGARVFRFYTLETPPTEPQNTTQVEFLANHHMMSSGKEEKELLESFATVFHHIDPATFHEVFQSEIPNLYEMMFDHAALLHIPQFLLASEATSPAFAGMLLQFLMEKMEDVGTKDTRQSSILLRLFKLSFMAVTLFSEQNEKVLLPHVTKLVTNCIKLSTTAEEPLNYFLLLRSLFRSIGGGRFEHLYKEILPLLEMILDTLNNLLMAARKPNERDLYVELSLTVPARLSNLLPHLNYLMRPLVVALRAGSDLIGQGLRTLELCVDNLTAEYLDPIMAPVIDELMAALWDHLRPNPYSHFHAHTTMRILGKLGGRNRKFINGPPTLDFKMYPDDESSFDIKLVGASKERAFPAFLGIDIAIGKLQELPKLPAAKKADPYHKLQSFRLLSNQLKLLVGFDTLPDDAAQLVRLQAQDLVDSKWDTGGDLMTISDREKSIAKRDAYQDTLKKLIKAMIFATSIPELKEEANSLLTNLYRHFVILEIGRNLALAKHQRKPFDVKSGEGPVVIDSKLICDAIVESLSSDHPAVREAAEEGFVQIRDAAAIILGDKNKLERLPFFIQISKVFCHACHEEEWFTKAGGRIGINICATRLGLSDAWLMDRQVDFVRALMYVMKDMPQDLPANTRIDAQNTLELLVKRCNKAVSKDDMKDQKSKLYNLCGFLVYDLAYTNRHVREATQRTFGLIAEAMGAEIHELILPVKDRLLGPIFNKPLRALPFATQIGYIDALTFCMKLQHGVLEFNEATNRTLMEVLALVDTEDEVLHVKPQEQRVADQIVALRVACIRLLSTAMGVQEVAQLSSPQSQARAKIIAVFFRSLYHKAPEVVEAANAGLRGVLSATQKLPKDLLQNGLRPILMNLQDPKKLSVEALDGLARLLTLLTNYFKVETGARLLQFTEILAEAGTLQKLSFQLIEMNKQMRVITASLNVFHLLPPAAVTFLNQLVSRVVELETALRRTRGSPFRVPLTKYLNHYPKDAWEYFAPLLKDHGKGRFFAQILADEKSGPLREAVTKDPQGFIKAFQLDTEGDEKWFATINAIQVAESITKFDATKDWLAKEPELRKALVEAAKGLQGKLRANVFEPVLRLAAEQTGDRVMRVIVTYMVKEPQDLDFFFELVDSVTAKELKLSPVLFHYIYNHIVKSESVTYQQSIISRCIETYHNPQRSQKAKTFALKNIANPILAMDIMRNWNQLFTNAKYTKLLDKGMSEQIHNQLWKRLSSEAVEDIGPVNHDHSRMEVLQMTTMLLKYHPHLVQEARKDVIRFGWNYIRLEDVINKHAAYVMISYFIAHYETPMKIAMQVYQTLLKAHQGEGRSLVTQALELLAPVLPKRMVVPDNKGPPVWAKIARKILAEESSNLQQLMSIFQFLIRHPELFFEARELLTSIIVPSLNRFCQPNTASNESKKLALNCVGLIWRWEVMAVEKEGYGSPGTKRRSDGSPVERRGSGQRVFCAAAPLRLNLIKYLVILIAQLPERYPGPHTKLAEKANPPKDPRENSTDMIKKALCLLRDLLSPPYWSDLDVDAMFPKVTEAVLLPDMKPDDKAEMWTTRVVNVLQILRILVNVKSLDWVSARLGQLQSLLNKPLKHENIEIADALHSEDAESEEDALKLKPLIARILEAIPVDKDQTAKDEDAMETDMTPSIATDFVSAMSIIAGEELENNHLIPAINILWSLSHRKPAVLDSHMPQILRVLQTKLAREHIDSAKTLQNAAAMMQNMRMQDPNAASLPDPVEMEIQTGLILKIIELVATRMSQLGEQRRPYLSVLASLVEKSTSIPLCEKILDMVSAWVFNPTEAVPTLKEKTAVLSKMHTFEQRQDPTLLSRFLDLVIKIYEDPKIARSELTVRMENAFLIGTRAQDVDMRTRFLTILDKSLSRTAASRISYVVGSQNWDALADSYWLNQVIYLMFGSVEMGTTVRLNAEDIKLPAASWYLSNYEKDERVKDTMVTDELETFMAGQRRFVQQLGEVRVRDIFEPLSHLQHADSNLAHDIWIWFFPLVWSCLTKDERVDLEKGIVILLTKEYNQRQMDRRPNCIKTFLEAIVKTRPRVKFPPQIMKYLAKNFNAWYPVARYMEDMADSPLVDTPLVRESNLDALVEIYANLQEDDLFYGTWRRRAQFIETNAALSYEQNGIWDKAQTMYEAAQIKARTGALPLSQGEYNLWEDHWVICAQKLQQWEILSDFAKNENFSDLYLEATWRHVEGWSSNEQKEQLDSIIKSVSDAPTPRRLFFQAFMSLLKLHAKTEPVQEFNRVCDEAIQLSIRQWHKLPKRITNAHIPLLQNFQQLVELHDASLICNSLHMTNQGNLDSKSQELKLMLSTWRDRLPNFWDDINAWQDLVTWRQHIFQLINNTYLALLPQQQPNQTGQSYAYRGYHETAWIINRFAHVARKHNLPEVCINQLSRIYTLPNIEIQEAFLKLREQAKCHYQNSTELTSGLDVINNTNLNYFGQTQKAEFYTLKGMFLAKLSHKDEANDAFGMALYYDIKLPKAWAEWGRYNDLAFKDDPTNIERAGAAISCYLEAAGQYKSHKSRKLISRILWLLSLDDAEGTLAASFDSYKGEMAIWFWIIFIPQLLNSLSRPEARICASILAALAKNYPQALFFQLRTIREDMLNIKKQTEAKEAKERQMKARAPGQGSPTVKQGSPPGGSRPGTANGDTGTPSAIPANNPNDVNVNGTPNGPDGSNPNGPPKPKKPWEYTEEINSSLKTAFPLLALSMESMVDQTHKHFKCPPDEDAYRLIVALLNDGMSYIGRLPQSYAADVKLPSSTEANITRFAESILPAHIRKSFEADFVTKKPTMHEYIQKLRRWRDRFEERLDARTAKVHLESYSAHLSEFKFQKFDEVEIPGQYLLHKDTSKDFVRIERFLPNVDLVRGVGVCHRRLKIRGHDGSLHLFAVQHPAARHSRREERIMQLFRIFNQILIKKKESRRRNLQFFLPAIVPFSPSIRIVQDDTSYISMQGIYEDYCRRNAISKDEPILFTMEKLRALAPKNAEQALQTRFETFKAIQDKYVPNTIILDFFQSTYPSFSDFWLFRRQFSYQLAALTFMTYIMHMNTRYPHKMTIARATGNIWGSELIPAMAAGKPFFHNPEPVPFRLTPNLQVLMGPLATEGIFTTAIMAIARSLVEPEHELEMQLSIFIRDEMVFWHTQQHRSSAQDGPLRESVQGNCEVIVNRAVGMAQTPQQGNLPASQTVIDLVSVATSPMKLCQTDPLWMGWL